MKNKFNQRLRKLQTTAIKRAFNLLYHSLAWTYNSVAAAVSLGQWYHWIEQTIPFIQGPAVLELGFGTGYLQSQLLNRNFKCFGLDQSRQMIKIASRNIQKESQKFLAQKPLFLPQIIQAEAQAIPFASETINDIVATFPTEYIFQAETLKEIYRVLTPDGTLILLPTAWITGKSIPARLTALLYQLSKQNSSDNFIDIWKNTFENFGFKIQEHWLQMPKSKLLILIVYKKSNSINSKN